MGESRQSIVRDDVRNIVVQMTVVQERLVDIARRLETLENVLLVGQGQEAPLRYAYRELRTLVDKLQVWREQMERQEAALQRTREQASAQKTVAKLALLSAILSPLLVLFLSWYLNRPPIPPPPFPLPTQQQPR